jgi:hypothetical protein
MTKCTPKLVKRYNVVAKFKEIEIEALNQL